MACVPFRNGSHDFDAETVRDDEGRLTRRFSILAMNAAGLVVGGMAGTLSPGFAWPDWVLFVAVTFAAGQALRIGKGLAMAPQHLAMPLAVTSGAPGLRWRSLWYPFLALLLVSLAH